MLYLCAAHSSTQSLQGAAAWFCFQQERCVPPRTAVALKELQSGVQDFRAGISADQQHCQDGGHTEAGFSPVDDLERRDCRHRSVRSRMISFSSNVFLLDFYQVVKSLNRQVIRLASAKAAFRCSWCTCPNLSWCSHSDLPCKLKQSNNLVNKHKQSHSIIESRSIHKAKIYPSVQLWILQLKLPF